MTPPSTKKSLKTWYKTNGKTCPYQDALTKGTDPHNTKPEYRKSLNISQDKNIIANIVVYSVLSKSAAVLHHYYVNNEDAASGKCIGGPKIFHKL